MSSFFYFFRFKRRYRKLSKLTHSRYTWFIIICVLIFSYTTLGFYFLERRINTEVTIPDALWWSIVTMTTVGYGDITPRSELTRMVVGYPAILLGVFFIGYILSDISTRTFEINRKARRGLGKVDMKHHLVLIRYVGKERIKNITAEIERDTIGYSDNIVLIDDKVKEIDDDLGVRFVFGDLTARETLLKANIEHARSVIVFNHTDNSDNNDADADADLRSIAIVLAVREISPSVPIITECLQPKHAHLLESAGSTHTVCLAGMREQIIVQELLDPGVVSVVHELTSNLTGNQLYIVDTPSKAKTYGEIKNLYQNKSTCPLGIRREGKNHLAPPASFPIEGGDKLICIDHERPTSEINS